MVTPENAFILNQGGKFFLACSGLEIVTGVAMTKSGFVSLKEAPTTFKVTVGCHLFVGLFCYFGDYFI